MNINQENAEKIATEETMEVENPLDEQDSGVGDGNSDDLHSDSKSLSPEKDNVSFLILKFLSYGKELLVLVYTTFINLNAL